jgi:type I restriction enzyme S subunit
MNNMWKDKRLDEIGEVISGATPNTSVNEYWDGRIEWITPNDLSKLKTRFITNSERKISTKGLNSCSAKLIPAGNLVMSSRAPIGYLAISTGEYCTNQGCKSIKLNKDQNAEFHYYNLLHNIQKVKNKGEGTTFLEISKSELQKLKFFSPPYKVQSKIALILATIDAQIEKTEAIIAKYQAIKQGMLHDLFTRGIDVTTGKLRPTYEQAPELYIASEIGMIPKGWLVKSVGQLIKANILDEIQDGNHGELHPKSSDFVNEGIPFVMASDISNDEIDFSNVSRISYSQYKSLRIGFSKSNDVLLSHKASIGFVAKVPAGINELMLTPQVTYYRVLAVDILSINYLESFMRSDLFQQPLHKLAKQSTRDYIGITMQKNLKIAYPLQIKEQQMISSLIYSVQSKLRNETEGLKKLNKLKQGLMSDLLSGKVPVTVNESEAV